MPASAARNEAKTAVGAIVGVSLFASGFLFWLLYAHHASADYAATLTFLPALNSLFNGLSAIALCCGLYFIKHRQAVFHRRAMMTAFVFSTLFLISYILHHALHGDTRFAGTGTVRTIYLFILITHICLSVLTLPLVLTTFFFSLTGRFRQHKKIARVTFPLWLYISVTGVVVFAMLSVYNR